MHDVPIMRIYHIDILYQSDIKVKFINKYFLLPSESIVRDDIF